MNSAKRHHSIREDPTGQKTPQTWGAKKFPRFAQTEMGNHFLWRGNLCLSKERGVQMIKGGFKIEGKKKRGNSYADFCKKRERF